MGKGKNKKPRPGRKKRKEEREEYDDGNRGSSAWVKENIQFLVIGGAIVILILAVVLISILTPESPPDNPDNGDGYTWQDMDAFQKYLGSSDYEYHNLAKTTDINSKTSGRESSSLLFIIGVEEEFTGPEIVAINDFLEDGGTIVIAADGNLANKVSEKYGVTYDGARVIVDEPGFFYNLSFIPAVATVNEYTYNIMFNAPTGFTTTGEGEILSRAEEEVNIVLDRNGDFVLDLDEHAPRVPFIVKTPAGNGNIVFISDAGLFTDKLFTDEMFENMAFTTKLISSLIPEDGCIYYDHSKQASQTSGHMVLPSIQ